MKREFLQNFKVGDAALPKEVIDAIMEENGRDIEAAKKPSPDYETVKQQLAEANKTIEGFKAMDIDGVKKAADEWKQKFEQAQKDADERIAAIQFDALLDSAITAARGRSTKAVKALLDMDALKASKDQKADVSAALEALKKESGYLFETETPPPYAAGTGTSSVGGTKEPATLAGALRERYETKG